MHDIKTLKEKNVCIIRLGGFMKEDEIYEAIEKIKTSIDELKPGMVVVNDISEFSPVKQAHMSHMSDLIKYVGQHSPSKVIRVTGEAAITKMQITAATKKATPPYEAVDVSSFEEAMKLI